MEPERQRAATKAGRKARLSETFEPTASNGKNDMPRPPWAQKLGDHTKCAFCLGEIPEAPKLGDVPTPEPCSPLEMSWLHAWRQDSTRNPKTGRRLKANGRLWRQTNESLARIARRQDPQQWRERVWRESHEKFVRQTDALVAACQRITEKARQWLSGCELDGEKLCCPLCSAVCAERLELNECHGCDSWGSFVHRCECTTSLELTCMACVWAYRYVLCRKNASRDAFLRRLHRYRDPASYLGLAT